MGKQRRPCLICGKLIQTRRGKNRLSSSGLCRQCLNKERASRRRCRACGRPAARAGALCWACHDAGKKAQKEARARRLEQERAARPGFDPRDPTYRAKQARVGKDVWARIRPIDRLARIAGAKARGFNGSHGRSRPDPAKLKALWSTDGYREKIAKAQARRRELWQAWRQTPIGQAFTADQDARRAQRRREARRRNKRLHGYPKAFSTELKRRIRERDGFRCQQCGTPEAGIPWQCHHINYDKTDQRPENLVLLCNRCHGKTQKSRRYWQAKWERWAARRKP